MAASSPTQSCASTRKIPVARRGSSRSFPSWSRRCAAMTGRAGPTGKPSKIGSPRLRKPTLIAWPSSSSSGADLTQVRRSRAGRPAMERVSRAASSAANRRLSAPLTGKENVCRSGQQGRRASDRFAAIGLARPAPAGVIASATLRSRRPAVSRTVSGTFAFAKPRRGWRPGKNGARAVHNPAPNREPTISTIASIGTGPSGGGVESPGGVNPAGQRVV